MVVDRVGFAVGEDHFAAVVVHVGVACGALAGIEDCCELAGFDVELFEGAAAFAVHHLVGVA